MEPPGPDGASWWVASEAEAGQSYPVVRTPHGPWPCTCSDFHARQDWGAHGLAVALLRRCAKYQAAPDPDPDAPIPFTLTARGFAVTREPAPAA